MASLTITEGELLEALAHSQKPGEEGARTVEDMALASGLAPERVRRALKALQRDGRLTVYRVRRPAIDGRQTIVPAYSITKKKTK